MSDLVRSAANASQNPELPQAATGPLVKAGIAAAVLTGFLTTIHDVLDARSPGIDAGAGWSLLHFAWVSTMALATLGLTVLQWHALDRFGRFAARFATVATASMGVLAAVETIALAFSTPDSSGDPAIPVLVVMFAVMGSYVVGLFLFGVATLRAGVLSRLAAVPLLVAIPVKMALGDFFGPLAVLGLAFTVLGIAAARVERDRRRSLGTTLSR